jgi:hypothetical protein
MALSNINVTLGASANQTLGTAGSLGNAQIGRGSTVTSYEDGAGAGAVNVPHVASYSVVNPTTTSIDLRAGSIKQPNGETASFASIEYLELRYISGTGIVTVGGTLPGVAGTLEQVGDTIVVHKPIAGITVTQTTADTLTLASSSGTVVVDVTAFGRAP